MPEPSAKTATVLLSLRIENNNSFVRGKKRVKDGLEPYLRHQYAATLQLSGQYRLKVPIAPMKNSTARWPPSR